MFGIRRKFKCTECGKEQIHEISFTSLYKINDNDVEYVDLLCEECGELHYVVSEGYIVNEITNETKESIFKEMEPYLGSGAETKKDFLKNAKFVLAIEAVISHKNVKSIKDAGIAAF